MDRVCSICDRGMPEWGKEEFNHHNHLVITKSGTDDHIHVHGDIENKEVMKELVEAAKLEIGFTDDSKNLLKQKEIVFHNRQRMGDILTFTCAIRDFKAVYPDIKINVISTAGHIWDHNPYIDRSVVPTPENTVKIGPGLLTNASNRLDWHMTNAYRMSMEDKLKISIPQGESRPDVWFTQEEYDSPRVIDKPYWIICVSGEKGWGCKMYPFYNWQKVVNQNPGITFVQIGAAEDHPPRLQGDNVIDYVGKTQHRDTGIRDLFKLFLNAEGSIGLVSFHMHLSGALHKPSVVIAGGREPVSFTRYPGHAYLSTDGMLPCATKACWHCAIDTCTNLVQDEQSLEKKIPKCVDIISPEDITKAIKGYYAGGRLRYDNPSEKPKLKSIVPTPEKVEDPSIKFLENINTYGMTFGGGSLTEDDWIFIRKALQDYNVKTVLEFGAGLSTLLFNDVENLRVTTYETNPGWVTKIKASNPKCDVKIWDGVDISLGLPDGIEPHVDFAFVDGPAGDMSREWSTRIASESAKVIVVHDAGRPYARRYQEQYIQRGFEGPIKGGHRCHLWVKKGFEKNTVKQEDLPSYDHSKGTPISIVNSPMAGKKTIKIVSTARGWGGCARSVTTIMRLLLQNGHDVEFIPFRNAVTSREFKEALSGELRNVKVSTEYSRLSEACDTVLFYADDFVWDFPKPELADHFSNINSSKKIMMLNFRRGKVGQVEWTKGWDEYIFLNSGQEKDLLDIYPAAQGRTRILPPCTDLTEFFKVKPNYSNGINIVRHSSQGDTKFDKDKTTFEIKSMLYRLNVKIKMLPGPSFIFPIEDRFEKVPRTADPKVIAQFLSTGNLFWYSLPEGYMDMGPRVILEAMASGLPVLADNWGGAADRVTPECGWITDTKEQQTKVVHVVTPKELKEKGESARERAYSEFRPEKWVEILTS